MSGVEAAMEGDVDRVGFSLNLRARAGARVRDRRGVNAMHDEAARAAARSS